MTKSDLWLPDQVEIDRAKGLVCGVHEFVRMAWPHVDPSAYVDNWHVGFISEHLEAVTDLQIRKLVINIPPGCMKSSLVCVFWPTWVWLRDPSARWMFASFDQTLTTRDAQKSLDLIQSDWFKARWGTQLMVGRDPKINNYTNNSGGWRFATSIKGKATGYHPDYRVVDDPIKPLECTSDALAQVKRWKGQTWATRAADQNTVRDVVIMQRLHTDDLAGECVEQGYTHVRLPMRFVASLPCKTPIGEDPRTEDGELLFPERYPEEVVTQLETDLGEMAAASQLQQDPMVEGGTIFKSDSFRTYKELPEKMEETILSVDCAFKDLKSSDWVVVQVWGRCGSSFYLLDQWRKQAGFTVTCQAIRSMAEKWPKAMAKLVEDKANGTAVVEVLRKEISGLILVDPQGGKTARAQAVTPLFDAGNVFDPDPSLGHPWMSIVKSERLAFPLAKNDDTVDATTQALLYLHLRSSRFKQAMDRVKKKGLTNMGLRARRITR
jgi:predicted phage terminase large subunit-like protein